MAVGDKFAFLAYGTSTKATVDTAGATVTLANSNTGLVAQACRITNASTTPVYITFGSTSITPTANATVAMCVLATQTNVVRTGGNNIVALTTAGATQTTTVILTAGEGIN